MSQKTLPAITAELIEAAAKRFSPCWNEEDEAFLRAALLKVAEETYEAVMPEKKLPVKGEGRPWAAHSMGYNEAVAEIKSNFKTFINQWYE